MPRFSNPNEGWEEGDVWVSPGKTLYHATLTENLDSIVANGLLPFQPTLWSKGRSGERYGEGQIFVFTDKMDATIWAGKIGQSYHPKDYATAGRVCVVSLKSPKGDVWEYDTTFDPMKLTSLGLWLKRYEMVPPNRIKAVKVIGHKEIRRAIKKRDEKYYP